VYLSIKQAQTQSSTINLRIVGEERAVIHHTTTVQIEQGSYHHGHSYSTQSRDENHYEESTSTFFNIDYPIAALPAGQVGQYEYPFSVKLPHTLPSTMFCRKGQSYCEIKYEIKAKIGSGGGGFFSSPPHATRPLHIFSVAPPTGPSTLEFAPEHIPVTSCCCRSRGTMMLQANVLLEKSALAPNETFQVSFACGNRSTKSVHTVRIELIQVLEWRANSRTERVQRTLAQQDLDPGAFAELEKLRTLQPKMSRYFGGAPHQEQGPLNTPPQHVTQLMVPSDPKDSYVGRWIEVRHMVTVRLKTKGCCTTNPEATMRCHVVSSCPDKTESSSLLGGETSSDAYGPPAAAASAPSAMYDDNGHDPLIIAEAELVVLPVDWYAEKANVIEIPMAEATLLGPASAGQWS
jgi:hypothetical protein